MRDCLKFGLLDERYCYELRSEWDRPKRRKPWVAPGEFGRMMDADPHINARIGFTIFDQKEAGCWRLRNIRARSRRECVAVRGLLVPVMFNMIANMQYATLRP